MDDDTEFAAADYYDDPEAEADVDITEAASRFKFPERLKHFLGDECINDRNREAVEMCILCEVGRIVTVDETVKGDKRADMLVAEYKGLVESLPCHLFVADSLKANMVIRQKNGRINDGMKARTLMEKWGKAQTALKKVFSALPDGYHKMALHSQVVHDH